MSCDSYTSTSKMSLDKSSKTKTKSKSKKKGNSKRDTSSADKNPKKKFDDQKKKENCKENKLTITESQTTADVGSNTDINPEEKKYSGDYTGRRSNSCSCYTTSDTDSDSVRPTYSKKKKTK